MVQSQFSLSWDAYKSNICSGFSSLQQNGEFVDMTLAADGHFVKVHQVLMALVSPYLKELISSAPCQHPVIFLNVACISYSDDATVLYGVISWTLYENVSHRTLTSLLEYVYTGEVLVPSETLTSFIETAKALHIKGLEDITNSEETAFKIVDNTPQFEGNEMCHISGVKRLALPVDKGSEQINLPAAAKKILLKRQKPSDTQITEPKKENDVSMESRDNMNVFSDMMDDTGGNDSDYDCGPNKTTQEGKNIDTSKDAATSNVQYSVSIRGSLQVILNRYIYNLHSSTTRAGVRRWRCVDYRNNRCKAFVVTKGNVVLNRANLHNHSFHDKKILQKIEKQAVFSAIDDVEGYKMQQQSADTDNNESGMESDYVLSFADAIKEAKKEWTQKQT